MRVERGHRYQGAASLPWPISSLADEQSASEYLREKGWVDVAVWDSATKLPATWPANKRSGDVFAKATWGGESREYELPSQVTFIEDLGAVKMASMSAGEAAYQASKNAGPGTAVTSTRPSVVKTALIGVGLLAAVGALAIVIKKAHR